MINKRALAVSLLMALGTTLPVQAADSLLHWDGHDPVKVYHVYSASDGNSYVEEVRVPLQNSRTGVRELFDFTNVEALHIGTSHPHELGDWHYATHRHLIMPLQGVLRFDTGDGKDHLLRPGEIVVAEDWTGKGHRSGCDPQNKVECVAVDAELGPIDKSLPLRSPPDSLH